MQSPHKTINPYFKVYSSALFKIKRKKGLGSGWVVKCLEFLGLKLDVTIDINVIKKIKI